jgi:hypothetical protein
MSIPRQLIKSFDIIRDCKLVVSKEPTEDNLKEFGKAINNAIPDDSNQISYMIYKFMRGMYLRDKAKFIRFIEGMPHYESMILWTDYDDILRHFELVGVIFLGWNKSVNKYQAAQIDPTKRKEISASRQSAVQQDLQVVRLEKSDDYDALYARIAQLQATLAQPPHEAAPIVHSTIDI